MKLRAFSYSVVIAGSVIKKNRHKIKLIYSRSYFFINRSKVNTVKSVYTEGIGKKYHYRQG